MKYFYLILALAMNLNLFASQLIIINPLGSSSKGQYIAIEEYVVTDNGTKINYQLKFYNAWKNSYGPKPYKIIADINNEEEIQKIREQAIEKNQQSFKKFGIKL